MQIDLKNLAAGAFFASVGLFYGTVAWLRLPVGSTFQMGPGYFPLVLSAILILLGLAIGICAFRAAGTTPFGGVPWRAVIFLSLAIIFFAAFVEEIGMLASVFVAALFATLSSPSIRLSRAVIASAGVAIFCTAVFSVGLRLPIPIIGPWLRLG